MASEATRAARARRANKLFPAHWVDVTLDPAAALEFARAAMAAQHFTPHGAVSNGVWMFRYGTPVDDFFSDVLGLSLIYRLFGRSDEYARIAVWTEALPAGTRLTVSLLTGLSQAPAVHRAISELIASLSIAGVVLQVGEPFSGLDLPSASPGQPFPRRRARQEAKGR